MPELRFNSMYLQGLLAAVGGWQPDLDQPGWLAVGYAIIFLPGAVACWTHACLQHQADQSQYQATIKSGGRKGSSIGKEIIVI